MRIPNEMPPEKRAVLEEAVEALNAVDRITAVVLGGSYARGTQHAQSDIDIGTLCCSPIMQCKEYLDRVRQ